MKRNIVSILLAVLFAAAPLFAAEYKKEKLKYQDILDENILYVLVTFDGSYSLEAWNKFLEYSEKENIKFTFYVSGVSFLGDDEKNNYVCPYNKKIKGVSEIKFGGSDEDVKTRIELARKAQKDGHSMEIHLNGHFSGANWKKSHWDYEFEQFFAFTGFLDTKPRHIRFPLLAYNENVYDILKKYEIKTVLSTQKKKEDENNEYYKVSVSKQGEKKYVFYEFPIPVVKYGDSKTIMMDYNLWLRDNKSGLTEKKLLEKIEKFYLSEADLCFEKKMPFFVSLHFTPYLQDAYWKSLKNAIKTLKERYGENIKFITIEELYLKAITN